MPMTTSRDRGDISPMTCVASRNDRSRWHSDAMLSSTSSRCRLSLMAARAAARCSRSMSRMISWNDDVLPGALTTPAAAGAADDADATTDACCSGGDALLCETARAAASSSLPKNGKAKCTNG